MEKKTPHRLATTESERSRRPIRPFFYATMVLALAGASLPFMALPASAIATTVVVTAVVNQNGSNNGPPAWSTKNVTSASQGATVRFTAKVTGNINPATGSVQWALTGTGNPTCPTSTLVGGLATCTVFGVLPPTLSATATYLPGNDPAAAPVTDTITITTPANFPFSSGTPIVPPFTECPAVGGAFRGCNDLLILNPDGSTTFLTDPKQPQTFDGFDDTLVGILNNTGIALPSAFLTSTDLTSGHGIFHFDGDGVCSSSNTNSGQNFASTWVFGGSHLSALQTGCPYGPTGYEGPFTAFSNYSAADNFRSGTVTFTEPGGLANGASTFFSLENKVTNLRVFHPTITTTTPSQSTILLGQSITDTAVVTGDPVDGAPTGNVNFYLCGPGATTCSSTASGAVHDGPIALGSPSGDTSSATSHPLTPTAPGRWCFAGIFAGTVVYSTSFDASTRECFTVTPPPPSAFTTTPSGVTVGSPASDSASVTGNAFGGSPTGTITFFECGPNAASCDTNGTQIGAPVNLHPGPLNTATATSPSWTPAAPGTYCYAALYTPAAVGAKYIGASHTGSDECLSAGQVSLSKSSSPQGTVAPGQTVTYTITATNGGGAASAPVHVSDTVPTGTSYVAGSASCNGAPGCTASEAANTVSFVLNSLAPFSSAHLSFSVTVNPGTTATITNSATFTGPNCSANCSSNPTSNPVAALGVTKVSSAGGGTVTAGETVTYTLAATNNGSGAASASVTDSAPSGTTLVPGSASCPGNSNPSTCSVAINAGLITWTLTDVPPGTTYALTYAVTVNLADPNGSTITNTGHWSGQGCVPNPPLQTCSTNTVTNIVETVLPPRPFTTTPSGATAGSPATDSASVTGNSFDGSPTGTITFFECGPNAASCDANGTQIGSPVNLVAGPADKASATSPSWTPSAPGTYCYAALYTPPPGGKYAADSSTGSGECFSVGQVSLSKTSSPQGTVAPGQTLTYAITASNSGGAASGPVNVSDPVPAGTTYVAGSASCNGAPGCTASESAGIVSFALTSIGPASSDHLTFLVTVNPGVTATITNQASFTGPNCITNCVSNPPQNPVADLTVTKASSPQGSVSPGGTLTYTLAATNIGSGAASGTVIDSAPSGTTLVPGSASCPGNSNPLTCSVGINAGVITWTLTNVPPGTTYALTYAVSVNQADPGGTIISNTGAWSGQGCIPQPPAQTCSTNTVTNMVNIVLLSGFETTTKGGADGSPASDSALVTGDAAHGSPTGTITFFECGPGASTCSTSDTQLGPPETLVAGSGNTATANSVTWNPINPGQYCYAALYTPAPGSAYAGATHAGPSECFTVGQV